VERDYQKEAWQIHLLFHKQVLESLERHVSIFGDTETKDLKKTIETAHNLFDTLVLWVEQMQKEIYRIEGEVRAARGVKV